MTTSTDGRTVAIVSYITFIGLIVALFLNADNKNDFASYHIRNMAGICLFGAGTSLMAWIDVPNFLVRLVQLGILILWIIGIVSAVKEEKKELPIVGSYFQDWFKTL